jgi:hypothetical protein
MIDVSGMLLIAAVLAVFLGLLQRVEHNRRLLALFILALGAYVAIAFGLFRISNRCFDQPLVCQARIYQGMNTAIAYNTVNAAIVLALVIGALAWLFIGRYNPPGTSDDIRVLGVDD